MSDDSNLSGKGSDILLPKQGNPFKKTATVEEVPRDLSPEDVADLYPVESAPDEPIRPETYMPPPPPRLSASTLFEPAQPVDADLPGFDPDALIVDSQPESETASTNTPIEISSFNPEAPVGAAPFMPSDSTMTEATSIKADDPDSLPPTGPSSEAPILTLTDTFAPASAEPPTPAEALPSAITISTITSTEPDAELPEPAPAGESPASAAAPSVKIDGSIVHVDSMDVQAPRGQLGPVLPDMIDGEDTIPKELPLVPNDSLQLPLKEDEKLIKKFVTEERIQALWTRMEETEKQVITDMASLRHQRTANLEKLRTARNIILAGRENYEDTLRYVAEVEADLLYIKRVRGYSFRYGTILTIYNTAWIVGTIYAALALSSFVTTAYTGTPFEAYGLAIWFSMLGGAMGGVTKSIVSLVSHITKQDFDSQFTIWYVSSPFAGVILGIFVWMFTQVGIGGAMGAVGIGSSSMLGANNIAGVILYGALAWLVGFQQNLVFKLVDRLKKALLNEEEERDEA
jgi:hypothetical protein